MGKVHLSMPLPNAKRLALAASLLGMAQAAHADDFVALCKAQANAADADRVCTCAAVKLDAADRPAALAALTTLNDAALKGKPIDPATLPPGLSQGMTALVQAQAACK